MELATQGAVIIKVMVVPNTLQQFEDGCHITWEVAPARHPTP